MVLSTGAGAFLWQPAAAARAIVIQIHVYRLILQFYASFANLGPSISARPLDVHNEM